MNRPAMCRAAHAALALLLVLPALVAADEPFPLEPPDTSSPHATLRSFMSITADGLSALRRGEHPDRVLARFARAERCLDTSELSPDLAARVAAESALLLYEVLNRVGLPDPDEVPDAARARGDAAGHEAPSVWTVPRTEIAIVRVDAGERAGEFLFGPRTVRRALEFYEKVKHLPHATSYPPGNYEQFITRPGIGVSFEWADDLPRWANARVLRNPIWKWAAVALTVALGMLAVAVARRLGRRAGASLESRIGQRAVRLVFAIVLTATPLAVELVVRDLVGLRFEAYAFVSKALMTLAFAAAVYATFALVELVAAFVIASRHLREQSLDADFIRVTARLISIAAGVALVIQAAKFLGLALGPVLAGLGLGGLAVALAARPTLENIIGGVTLFADRPVRVGDFCRFGNDEGIIEEIGLRSTRVRKRDDTLVSIPNADFSQRQLQNNDRRRRWLYRTTIGLRYETSPEQLRYVLAAIRAMLVGHPRVSPDMLFVRFVGFGDYSLDVELFAYIRTRRWLTYQGIREDINLRIMDLVSEAGTGFAFPSRTAYLARDSGLDPERAEQAEAEVQAWRREGRLPFPEFGAEREEALTDRLDYPPEGSPQRETPPAGG